MDERARALVRTSAALAAGVRGELRAALQAAIAVAEPLAIEEALLQSYLFLGYPRALQGLGLWRELTGRPPAAPAAEDQAQWIERGERVCRTVYGEQYERLRSNVAALHPDLELWMVHEGYGKVLARPGLELATRELCIVAVLAVQDAPAQLYSHLRGALNAGANAEDVEEALKEALRFTDAERAAAARSTWQDVLARRQERAARDPSGE